jgi:hypothetical protein
MIRKNALTAADAQHVEERFRGKLISLAAPIFLPMMTWGLPWRGGGGNERKVEPNSSAK